MEINKYYSHIYVIAMPERINYITKVMKILGIKAKIVPAVNRDDLQNVSVLYKKKFISTAFLKKTLKNEKFPIVTLTEIESNQSPVLHDYIKKKIKGVLALHLSYLKVFELFLDETKNNTTKHCLIFEDDILIPKNIKKVMQRFSVIHNRELKDIDWDVINYGRCFDRCNENKKYSKNIVTQGYPMCTHCCGYSKRVIEHLIKIAFPMNCPVDHTLGKLFSQSKYKCFSITPRLFEQNKDLDSLLGNPIDMPECVVNKKIHK